MRRSVIAVAVTAYAVAAASRRADRAHRSHPTGAAHPAEVDPGPIPSQRARTELEQLVDGDADLVLADQEAQDEHILAALDQLVTDPHRSL